MSRSAHLAPEETEVGIGAPIQNRNGLPTSSINILVFDVPSDICAILIPKILFEEKFLSTLF
ncbi:MAG: hypothetical protein EBT92_08740 [Planctomycetes bacterium]|nr:hypothetical protein [Planctomycetota bacterium]NBY00768.1 hypothetical protein [Planctomycetota bacterium]